jgi:hypothetical protein
MSGQLRVDEITNEDGSGSPSFPNGVQATEFNSTGTGANVMPVGTTAQRPASPAAGMYRLNTDTGLLENYTGTEWSTGVDVGQAIADFASGAPGQPRLVGNAVSVFPGTYPVLTVTASDAFSVANGLNILRQSINMNNGNSNLDGPELQVIKYTGTIRFRLNLTAINFLAKTYSISVFKNNVLVQNFSGSYTSPTGLTIDISVVPNDVILWRLISFSGGETGFQGMSMGNNTASNGYLLRELFAPAV